MSAGTPAPSFQLPDIYGNPVSLETYQGRQVLLMFSDPNCVACDQIIPRLVDLHRQHPNNGLDIMMLSRGNSKKNRQKAEEYGIEFPVVLQKRRDISSAYGISATPVAFLIDENGVIARTATKRVDEILDLTQRELKCVSCLMTFAASRQSRYQEGRL